MMNFPYCRSEMYERSRRNEVKECVSSSLTLFSVILAENNSFCLNYYLVLLQGVSSSHYLRMS
jgi:hypothetical protein